MLSYLISSAARRKLLLLLWGEGVSASASDLARLANVSFAAAHRELQVMEKAHIAQRRYLGNAQIYRANAGHPSAGLLKKLLSIEKEFEPLCDAEHEREILLHLKRMGAPIIAEGLSAKTLSLEDVLVGAFEMSHRNPTVARALPIILARNGDVVDFQRLRYLARQKGEERTSGFFFDLTASLSGKANFRKWAGRIFDKRVKATRDFFLAGHGNYAAKLANRNTPPIAKKWCFRMNMGMDSFASLYRKFMEVGSETI